MEENNGVRLLCASPADDNTDNRSGVNSTGMLMAWQTSESYDCTPSALQTELQEKIIVVCWNQIN